MKSENEKSLNKFAAVVRENYDKVVSIEKAKKPKKKKASKGAEKRRLKALKKAERNAKIIRKKPFFVWDKMKLYKPKNGLVIIDERLNVVADSEITHLKLGDEKTVELNARNGDFLLVLRRVDDKSFKYAAITVTAAQIIKAREQRLHLAYLGGDETVASLIKRDLGEQVDKRLKDPKKLIEKHKEDFLSTARIETVLKDIERILENY